MTLELCDYCYDAAIDLTDGNPDELEIEDLAKLMAEQGADVEDHECHTWHGGRPCACSCHPRFNGVFGPHR